MGIWKLNRHLNDIRVQRDVFQTKILLLLQRIEFD